MKNKSLKGGTHALRKRCPICRKVRKFYEPPGDQGGNRSSRYLKWKPIIEWLGYKCDSARPSWIQTPFGWGCVHCALRAEVDK